ncbi:6-phosphofructo-2-kinase-domain-containing protein [Mycotypha africana]|uniref:6-phosphofructo-2-kinase-domain-containing protein n=1 Tax=Mycotypha africana TaxID=64632 RepID=UPI002301A80B|nr:6-phosphofructo-2-kinase-domain-containing protein [Mycotypha africana]KAI8967957.1 6-phosphofructo-2-kinase-domain-containing protein [Mycotypha africana]
MVGLPARGKTYIASKVSRYLTWLGIKTQVFHVGNYRRKLAGLNLPHTFFDPHNAEAMKTRREAAAWALRDMIAWFEKAEGTVGILDATNSTKKARAWIHQELTSKDIQVLFIESICEDERVILSNIKDVKLSSPDYRKRDPEVATEDFMQRIRHYEAAYETITEQDLTYIKLINVGSQFIINMIRGYLESRIVYYLMNLHTRPKRIWFSRHGESLFNLEDKIGGDSGLSPRGEQYALKLPELVKQNIGDRPLTVWTSTMKRTIQTARHLPFPKKQWKALDELDTGICDGMTYNEIAAKYPDDFAKRDEDKFNYRYRGGESYRDLVLRLEPVIMDLERQENILIISHQATIRCMYAYFMGLSHDQLPYARIPLHTIIELTPRAYDFDVGAVDTFRPKGQVSRRLTNDKFVSASTSSTVNIPTLQEGASGEIADANAPILPITPVSVAPC